MMSAFGESVAFSDNVEARNWPQAAGPNNDWSAEGKAPPLSWSVSKNENILWKTSLPNGGQSGIAVWGDRLFLTTFSLEAGVNTENHSADIQGHCVDANTGEILWSVSLEGSLLSPMMYAYSDSTSPTPVTDGKRVIFTNASGVMASYDFEGNEQWRREWEPWGKPFPFNKQHEPLLYDGVVINLEPKENGGEALFGWNFLHGIDISTGKTLWIAEDATTSYTTSVIGQMPDGKMAVLTARGGVHDVPEEPWGLSLLSLEKGKEGKRIWRWVADTDASGAVFEDVSKISGRDWRVMWTMHWDKKHAYLFRLNPIESHMVFDIANGELLREQSMVHDVDYRPWNPEKRARDALLNVNLREVKDWSPRYDHQPGDVIRVYPSGHANITAGGYHYFLATVGHRRNKFIEGGKAGPSHSIGRVNIETGKTEYLEVPVSVIRKDGKEDEWIYGVQVNTTTLNAAGRDVAQQERSRNDGWGAPAFFGSPTKINGNIYFTTMVGVTYVIDADAPVFNEAALLAVNDLGPSGKTWSLNSISYSNGRIFHRSLKELVAIGVQ